jgi:hypothetical protein
LTVTYPANAAVDRKVFEDAVRAALQTEGNLLAWQKIAATQIGTFKMIAEYCDTFKAQKAVKRLHGCYCKVTLLALLSCSLGISADLIRNWVLLLTCKHINLTCLLRKIPRQKQPQPVTMVNSSTSVVLWVACRSIMVARHCFQTTPNPADHQSQVRRALLVCHTQ